MVSIRFDMSDFQRAGRRFGIAAKQMPFALSVALNDTAKDVKEAEERSLEQSLDRPTPFTKRAIGKTSAKKRDLSVEVFVKDIQATYLRYAVEGGTRRPKKRAITVPGKGTRLNRYGNMPRGSVRRQAAKSNTFVGVPRGFPDLPAGVWRRKKNDLQLLVLFTPSARYRRRWDFDQVFRREVSRSLPKRVVGGIRRAMATAR